MMILIFLKIWTLMCSRREEREGEGVDVCVELNTLSLFFPLYFLKERSLK